MKKAVKKKLAKNEGNSQEEVCEEEGSAEKGGGAAVQELSDASMG